MSKIKIFIVDDELDSRELLAYFLLKKQELEIVGYSADATNLHIEIRKHRPDVIFTDIVMPCINGVESAKQLQAFYPEIRFVFVTAHSNYRNMIKTINYLGFLLKPVDPDELDQCIERIKAEFDKAIG